MQTNCGGCIPDQSRYIQDIFAMFPLSGRVLFLCGHHFLSVFEKIVDNSPLLRVEQLHNPFRNVDVFVSLLSIGFYSLQ